MIAGTGSPASSDTSQPEGLEDAEPARRRLEQYWAKKKTKQNGKALFCPHRVATEMKVIKGKAETSAWLF